jgi:hypothetical protein
MADNDNKELMQFLEKQFEGVYKRLDNTASIDDLKSEIAATKDDLRSEIAAAKEETMRHTGVLIEAVRSDIKIVIEGLMGSNEKRYRDKEENEQEHRRLEKMSLINSADISALDQRVGKLEGRV